MKRLFAAALLWSISTLAVGWWCQLPPAQASTIQGTAVIISGLDDLNATIDTQARKGSGKIIALIFGIGGLGTMVAGYHMMGLIGVGAGLCVGFLPGIISSGFDAAPAATADLAPQVLNASWWPPLTAGLYPGFLALRCLQDPVFLAALAVGILVVRLARPAPSRAGLAR
jgi:hypothetical protein